jgi:class 3 adenylate cyclase
MFCDLVGYTRLSSKLDPEEVRALLEQFFGVIDATVERYGGTIDKHIGDAAMALFGARAPMATMRCARCARRSKSKRSSR